MCSAMSASGSSAAPVTSVPCVPQLLSRKALEPKNGGGTQTFCCADTVTLVYASKGKAMGMGVMVFQTPGGKRLLLDKVQVCALGTGTSPLLGDLQS